MILLHDWSYDANGILRCKRCQMSEHMARFKGRLLDCEHADGRTLDPLDEIPDCFMPKQAAAGRSPVPTRIAGKSEGGSEPVGGGGASLPLWLMSAGLALAIITIIQRGL